MYAIDLKMYVRTKVYIQIFIAILLILIKIWRQQVCHTFGE